MATNQAHNEYENPASAQANGGTSNQDFEKATQGMSHEEKQKAVQASRFGYGPLAHMKTNDSGGLLPGMCSFEGFVSICADTFTAFGGEFQPGLYKGVENRKFGNPAPLGLCAFALTTFVLSLINVGARDLTAPNIVVALAFGYGGLVQLLAGMWYVVRASKVFLDSHIIGRWLLAILSVQLHCHPTVASGLLSLSS